jgi:hypothetical protein
MRTAKLLPVLVLALVSACGGPSTTPTKAEQQPAADAGVEEASTEGAAEQQGVPRIASDEATFDFGSVAAHGTVEHVFTVKNVGTAELHIERVQRT